MIGRTISRYRILEKLGEGGMGVVYKAEVTKLHRPVALKFLSERAAGSDEHRARLLKEAEAAAALEHPNIATIYDICEEDERTFIAMAFVDGTTLADKIAQRPLPLEEALDIAVSVAHGLQAAHERGLAHRDIKPGNIMVAAKGQVKILDFGLAHLAGQTHITRTGTVMGTPAYMSPEQALAKTTDWRTDIWSLGVMIYQMITGQLPFKGEVAAAVAYAVVNAEPDPPTALRDGLPVQLDRVVCKALAKSREERYQHIDDMLVDLRSLRGSIEMEGTGVAPVSPILSAPHDVCREQDEGVLAPVAGVEKHIVGRQNELAALHAGLQQVVAGRSLLVGLAGEAGIGKTTLVEEFLDGIAPKSPSCIIVRGYCSERLAGTEAYLPFFDALDGLIHQDSEVTKLIRERAPWWYGQASSLSTENPADARLLDQVKHATQERVKRELVSFLQGVSRARPVVLFFEDLHWADVSTIDMLAYLGAKFDGMRLLVLATYRTAEMALTDHPFLQIRSDLLLRGRCREIQLGFLTQDDTERYLTLRYPGHEFPRAFVETLFQQTEGSPLFMVDLVRYLQDSGVIVEETGPWRLAQPVSEIKLELPDSISGMIQRKIAELSKEDHRLLAAASVQGVSFDSSVVARMVAVDEEVVEERLQVLESDHAFVELIEETEFPDRTLALRYRFVHVLYQNELYGSLTRTRRARLGRAAAEALEASHGERSTAIAIELASLYETARHFSKAVDWFAVAAGQALAVIACREAAVLARRGLEALEKLPTSSDTMQKELELLSSMSAALVFGRGYLAEGVRETNDRITVLMKELGERAQVGLATYYHSFTYYFCVMEIETSRDLADQHIQLAQHSGDRALLLLAHFEFGLACQYFGSLEEGLEHYEQVVVDVDSAWNSHVAVAQGINVFVYSLQNYAIGLWMRGYPEQAIERITEAKKWAYKDSGPGILTFYFGFAGFLYQCLGDLDANRENSEAHLKMASEHDLPLHVAWGSMSNCWSLSQEQRWEEAIESMQSSLATWQVLGGVYVPFWHALLADIYRQAGQPQNGLDLVAETLELTERTKHNFWDAELYRIKGDLVLARNNAAEEAEGCYKKALEVSRQQRAKSLELRAAVGLSRLWHEQGLQGEAHQLLSDVYGWFTEGFDTPDLREAQALLSVTNSGDR